MFDVALLGSGGMMPLYNRFLTSLLIRVKGKMVLIDCGEGTQITNKLLGWGFKNIDIICFTHFHADHISGLPGLILTMGNSDRREPLTIIGPNGLKKVYAGLSVIFPEIPFEVKLIELNLNEENFESEEMNFGDIFIKAIFVDHKIDCISYSIYIKRTGKFLPENAKKLNIPQKFWSKLQKMQTVCYKGETFYPEMVLGKDRKGLKVCYSTDTRPLTRLESFIKDADLFICEGLYGEEEKLESVAAKKHMIFSEAAKMAKNANVKELWLTHFSPALTDPESFIQNAKNVFQNTKIGKDRMIKTINFEN